MFRFWSLLILGSLAACGGRDVPSGPIAVTDDMGRTVSLPAPATRVVSLLPSFTEMLFAIGAGNRVIGRSRFDEDPPEALAVPSVGDGLGPNVEAIAALTPDLVLLYQSAANDAAVVQLTRLGIPVVVLRTDRLDDVARTARLLGTLTGTSDSADARAARFSAALDSARAVRWPADAPTALILAWDQPPIVIGRGSFQSELVALAGLRNVFDDVTQPSTQVSLETIVARDPDLVITTDVDSVPAWARRPEWRTVRAVRDGRFLRFDGSAFSHPSFRALEAVRRLRVQVVTPR